MEITFRVILAVVFIGFVAHRSYYSRKFPASAEDTVVVQRSGAGALVTGVLAVAGLASVVVYVAFPARIAFASLPLPAWLRWLGVAAAVGGFALLQWAQTTLGRNWSDTPRITRDQALVTHGPYQWIRHPIYTAFLLILGSSLLIAANWLVGGLWIVMTAADAYGRIRFEEEKLLAQFGEAYRDYQARTGRLLPRIRA